MVSDQPCSPLRPSVAKDFEGGIHLGIGGFNLVSTWSINLLSFCSLCEGQRKKNC